LCRRLFAFCAVLVVLLAAQPAVPAGGAGTSGRPETLRRLCDLDEGELDRLLQRLAADCPDFDARLSLLARRYVGCSGYCADPLTREEENWFPYRHTNCTMYVLYVTAMANSASYSQARCHMRRLHYRDGVVGFAGRYHFTGDRITDPDNPYFTDITAASVWDPSRLQSVAFTFNRGEDGGFFFGERLGAWSRQARMTYIPREGFEPGMLKPLPPVTGIAFVKKENWPRGVFVGHEGLLVGHDLYHSSRQAGVTVVRDFLSGPFAQSGWEGIMLFAINRVADARPCAGSDVPDGIPAYQDNRDLSAR
jgi:hypothetical protein